MSAPVYHYRRGPKTARKPRADPEHQLQVSVAQLLTYVLPPEVEWTSSLAGAHLSMTQRAKASAAGLRRGWPDMQFCISKRMYFVELKAPITVKSRNPERYGTLDDPDLSEDQRRVLGALHPSCWAVCRSLEEMSAALTSWGVKLRPYEPMIRR